MDDENENRKQQQKRTSDMTGFNFVFFFVVYISWIIIKTTPAKQTKRENIFKEGSKYKARSK